jgi:hypothetical protein
MDTKKIYIQYHNVDNLQCYPFEEANYETAVEDLPFDAPVVRHDSWINTTKKQVEMAMGDFAFLIVGKIEDTKKYYLWSFFRMDNYEFHKKDKYYEVFGDGFSFTRPILLNTLDGFDDFKKFCGNFGIGFQLITKAPFLRTLYSFVQTEIRKNSINFPSFNQPLPSVNEFEKKENHNDSINILTSLNQRMQLITPQKRHTELEQILREDRSIVEALKKIANYKCQYPQCNAEILMRDGKNYVEVAHIKSVKEGGKSVIGNLLVLCPNHHKEFDYGNLKIQIQTTKTVKGILNGKKFSINLISDK